MHVIIRALIQKISTIPEKILIKETLSYLLNSEYSSLRLIKSFAIAFFVDVKILYLLYIIIEIIKLRVTYGINKQIKMKIDILY